MCSHPSLCVWHAVQHSWDLQHIGHKHSILAIELFLCLWCYHSATQNWPSFFNYCHNVFKIITQVHSPWHATVNDSKPFLAYSITVCIKVKIFLQLWTFWLSPAWSCLLCDFLFWGSNEWHHRSLSPSQSAGHKASLRNCVLQTLRCIPLITSVLSAAYSFIAAFYGA